MAETTKEAPKPDEPTRKESNWPGVLFQLYIHSSLTYGLFFIFKAKLLTAGFTVFLIALGLLGTTAGAHRLWCHRSYSAHVFLRIFLMLCHTLGGNGPIYDWVLDHRLHHKFQGTDDDPFNHKKGFFYAHIGNRMSVQNPKRPELVKTIDMTDLESDKVVMFQKRFYWVLMPIINLLLPVNAPVEYWGESMLVSLMVLVFFRLPVMLHATWLVNSARSVWALAPNDRFFSDSNMVFFIKKSHWHTYHYTVPWDCLTDEFGTYNSSCTTIFIKIWAAMGLAKDLKTIDSRGISSALERVIDTGKSIEECITEVRDETELTWYEDKTMELLDSRKKNIN